MKVEPRTFLLVLLAIFGFLAFLIFRPYLSYIIFSIILVIVSFPLYKKLKSKLRNRYISAIIIIVSMFLLIIVPSILISFELFKQARSALSSMQTLEEITEKLYSLTGIDIVEIGKGIEFLTSNITSFLVTNIFTLTKTVANIFIGIFIMLFTMFYLYIDGEKMVEKIKKTIPMTKKHQGYIFTRTHQIIQALIVGIFFTGVLQGLIGGLGFFIFGVPNPVFWGFIMGLFSMIPFIGPWLIYIPASLFLMYNGNILGGLGLLVYGLILVSNLDNIIRPKIVRFREKTLHPLIIILGVIGGIAFMGISGAILGPLILALFLEFVKMYSLLKKKV